MIVRQFHGYYLSKLMLGTVQLGLEYGISNSTGKPSSIHAIKILERAALHDINAFDTARGYGQSEKLLGGAIQNIPFNKDAQIITKFGISPANENDLESAYLEALTSLKRSCKELQVMQVPICLFHCAMNNNVIQIAELLPGIINRLKNEGLLKHAGFSAYFPKDIPPILHIDEITMVQLPLSIFDQRVINENMLTLLKAEGKTTVARSVFLQGLFFLRPNEIPSYLAWAKSPLEKLRHLCQLHNISVAQASISFVRDLPGVDHLVIGAASQEQVDQLAKLMTGQKLSDTLRSALSNSFRDLEDHLLSPGLWNSESSASKSK